MSRAAQIVTNYSQGRDFSRHLSAEDLLALAYDEMADLLRKANAEREEMRQRLESTVAARALEVTERAGFDLQPNPRDWTWVLTLRPMLHEVRMMSADPAKWDDTVLMAVADQAAQQFASRIFKTFIERKKVEREKKQASAAAKKATKGSE